MTEFTLRARGADKKPQKLILGKFPTNVPDLRLGGGWTLEREAGQQWTLEGQEDTKFKGVPEVGLSGTAPSNYFILERKKGQNEFIAIPVDEWATFKPVARRAEFSLEDAEAQMKYQRLQAEKINPRLASAVGNDGRIDAGPAIGAEEEADSDDEWKDIKARAASLAAPGSIQAQFFHRGRVNSGVDEDIEGGGTGGVDAGALYVPRPQDAEDWEHESEAADDDLDMGDGSEGEVEASPSRRRPPVGSDSDGEGDLDASRVKRTIRKLMKATGLQESDEDGSEEGHSEEGHSGDDYDEDDEDGLDKMAEEILDNNKQNAERTASIARKRKSPVIPPEPTAAFGAVAVGGAGQGEHVATAKKARVQQEPFAVPAASAAGGGIELGEPTKEEVVALLQTRGQIPVKDFSNHFKARVGKASKKSFSELVKNVARIVETSDGKFMVLK